MELPAFSDSTVCVAPDDILLRRVGKTSAAIVSNYHRCHPVDANLAIIRGLRSRQGIWLAFCLNQPLYKGYLEQQVGMASMVRVGLKHLAKMPIAPCPDAFYPLADKYLQHYQTLTRSEDSLFTLRKTVKRWVDQRLPTEDGGANILARFFKARDLAEQLNYAASEQLRQAHWLTEAFDCVPLSRLAVINPKDAGSNAQLQSANTQVVKIRNLDGQQAITFSAFNEAAPGWRVHKCPLSQFDVLISTFVQEPKVAIVSTDLGMATLASEQLAVLNFHHSPGAYALLMEMPLIRRQISRLATGTVQRFVQPRMLANIVLPEIDRDIASQWHHQLMELLETKARAGTSLDAIEKDMYQVYRQVHPETNTGNRAPENRKHQGVGD